MTDRQFAVLRSLFHARDRWVRPMDVGGHTRSHHHRTLLQLVRDKLAQQRGRHGLLMALSGRPSSYAYRITRAGIDAMDAEIASGRVARLS